MRNKITLLLLLFTTVYNTTFSQEKIKGNKNITRIKTDLNQFNKISVNNDFKVVLFKSANSFVEVETDDNLHNAIEIKVIDSILTISTTAKLRAKRLNITVYYNNPLQEIILNNDAEIESLNVIKTPAMLLQINDYTIANLSVESNKFNLINNNKSRFQLRSKSKIDINSKEVNLDLSESSNTEITIKADSLTTRLMKNAIVSIKGSAISLEALTLEDSNFKGEELIVTNCNTTVKESASFTIQTSDKITIDASDKSKTEVYGEPQIIIQSFTGSSTLSKKEL
ncbi:GIN domain-containing protein [Polaribacter sp. L3A8]|uniref:GIN domain-containing protein n=1 Tax=Polaribacter sp. L3A8 TaxID=2686361 RepID=UPI00131D45E8|nr:DUF2807 domain-containing protein [Polaribacter sp. L3A8]